MNSQFLREVLELEGPGEGLRLAKVLGVEPPWKVDTAPLDSGYFVNDWFCVYDDMYMEFFGGPRPVILFFERKLEGGIFRLLGRLIFTRGLDWECWVKADYLDKTLRTKKKILNHLRGALRFGALLLFHKIR